jgi:hypothetical protein
MGGVAYQIEPSLSADEFVDVLRRTNRGGCRIGCRGNAARTRNQTL